MLELNAANNLDLIAFLKASGVMRPIWAYMKWNKLSLNLDVV